MLKVLLQVFCDGCKQPFQFARSASSDTSAWEVHGDTLIQMALQEDWTVSSDGNLHFCACCNTEDSALQFL